MAGLHFRSTFCNEPMAASIVRFRILTVAGALLLLAGCVEPAVVSATAQRSILDEPPPPVDSLLEPESDPSQSLEPLVETGSVDSRSEPTTSPTPLHGPAVPLDDENSESGGASDDQDAEAVDGALSSTEDRTVAVATIPGDVCDELAAAPLAGAIEWSDIDLGREADSVPLDYVGSAGDPNRAFVAGTLRCSITYADGAVLAVSAYSNYNTSAYPGSRLSTAAAGTVDVLVAADPDIARAVVEYPWAPSPTGFAALEVSFSDPDGIDAAEIDAIEKLAVDIRDRARFAPPTIAGPAYPDWYRCSLTRFGTDQGDTRALAEALDQGIGLHGAETIDRQFGTSRCSLYEGPGTASSGGFAVDEVFVALAAYESGRPTFNDTLEQVLATPGIVEGELVVATTAYRTIAAPGSLAVIIEAGGNGVMSVFDPEGVKSQLELQTIMTTILQQLFG